MAAITPYLAESQVTAPPTHYSNIALIGPEGRQVRDPSSNPELEKAQGRLYCLSSSPRKGKFPSAQYIKSNSAKANAFLAFKEDIIIVNRHNFILTADVEKISDIHRCYFEHIYNVDLIPLVDVEYIDDAYYRHNMNTGEIELRYRSDDFAVARLKRAPSGGKAVPYANIIVDVVADISATVTIISNLADNFKGAPKGYNYHYNMHSRGVV
ncbi:hypothetical protein [Mesorhizobium sp. M2A.F.Ca.ET.039.01.1.1]|uniref:hypothetical protein n=1 Tax=Mesorhizobium sp. M2A.F.Ca.ET.039.01.1.1 TaxID=2496746 RepID=UPI000FCCCD20|nr:hypothetical protein [Mesorhizobium sp. M2A.F.Ca.ET.039.01.1.1]RWX60552.1 hypothetical protein EOA24_32715 [Mesorhizobium sp. M2A.F.Ca.ET.039.01.1.1]